MSLSEFLIWAGLVGLDVWLWSLNIPSRWKGYPTAGLLLAGVTLSDWGMRHRRISIGGVVTLLVLALAHESWRYLQRPRDRKRRQPPSVTLQTDSRIEAYHPSLDSLVAYQHHTVRVTFSESGDWSGVYVELVGSDAYKLQQLLPVRLTIIRSGITEVVCDVFRVNTNCLSSGPLELCREGYNMDRGPGIYSGSEMGYFDLKPCSLALAVCRGDTILKRAEFLISPFNGNKIGFTMA